MQDLGNRVFQCRLTAVNAGGGWLHNIAGEAYVVVPDGLEAFAALEGVEAKTVKNRPGPLGRARIGGRGWVHGTERNGPGAWRRQNDQCARDRHGSQAGPRLGLPRLGTEYDSPARRDRASALRRSGTASFLAEGWSECWATDEGQGSWGSRSGRRHGRSVACPTAEAPV